MVRVTHNQERGKEPRCPSTGREAGEAIVDGSKTSPKERPEEIFSFKILERRSYFFSKPSLSDAVEYLHFTSIYVLISS